MAPRRDAPSARDDGADNLFPVTITNPAGEAVTTVWDPLCSKPTQATDANGQVATQQYDALCRLTHRDGPLGTYQDYFYEALGDPNAQHTRVESPSPTGSGTHHAESYFDGFGRAYHSAVSGPSGSDIVSDTAYDQRSNVASKTQPYFAGGTPETTLYTYDALDRLVTTTLPDGTPLPTTYGLWEVTSQDPHGHPTTTRYDAYGRKAETERSEGGQPVVTSYSYDLLGRMTDMSDAAGNQWEWFFDSLGRNYLIDDPDAGIRTFTFDDAGRTLEILDALNQKTEFTYDAASGRLTSKTNRHADNSVYRTISYDYGEARSGYFNVGQLTTHHLARGRDAHRLRRPGPGRSHRARFREPDLRARQTLRLGGPGAGRDVPRRRRDRHTRQSLPVRRRGTARLDPGDPDERHLRRGRPSADPDQLQRHGHDPQLRPRAGLPREHQHHGPGRHAAEPGLRLRPGGDGHGGDEQPRRSDVELRLRRPRPPHDRHEPRRSREHADLRVRQRGEHDVQQPGGEHHVSDAGIVPAPRAAAGGAGRLQLRRQRPARPAGRADA